MSLKDKSDFASIAVYTKNKFGETEFSYPDKEIYLKSDVDFHIQRLKDRLNKRLDMICNFHDNECEDCKKDFWCDDFQALMGLFNVLIKDIREEFE